MSPAPQMVMARDDSAFERRVRLDGLANQALRAGRTRLVLAGALFAFAFAVLGIRLADVMLLADGFEPHVAQNAESGRAQLDRRDIVDRNGVLLATNLPTAALIADPTKVLDAEEAAAQLASVLPGVSRQELLGRLTSAKRFVYIKRNLTPRQQEEINRLGLPGFAFQRSSRRVYPTGPLFSHVVGFADIDNNGLTGIEQALHESLGGAAGVSSPEPLVLSLDSRVQYILRDELMRVMAEFRAVGATGVVLDARTSEVVAMVSLPDFDPNDAGGVSEDARFNRATLGAYEMGSTFKLFTVAMALDSGTVTLDDEYDASKPIRVSHFVIRDFKPQNRSLSVPEILVHSSNIGAAKIALDVGTARQRAYFARFGLTTPASVELPEVATPIVPSPWTKISTMTAAYGYGIAVSPLQLATGIATLVNGGVYNPPTLLKRAPGEAITGWRAISPETSAQMRGLMYLVVAEGTGKKSRVPGYFIGGKTGTAEKAGQEGYREKSLVSSFVAAFPIEAPRYVVFAMLDEPKGNESTFNYATGGWTAAPAVGRVIARLGPMVGIGAAEIAGPDALPAGLMMISQRKDGGVAF